MLENLEKPAVAPVGCRVAKLAQELGEKDGGLLLEYVNDESWIAEHLARALAARGVKVGPMTIRIHRKGQCICRNAHA